MQEQPIGKIYAAIPAIMAEVKEIPKSRKNQQQGYAFRGIDDAYNALQGPMAKHGVFVVPKVIKRDREERQTKGGGTLLYTILEVEHTFYASDGSSVCATTTGESMDSGDKSCNKALSGAMKYALLEVFCIPTEADNDTENHSPEVAAKKEPQKPAPAPPVKSLMTVAEGNAAHAKISDAFTAKGFSPEATRKTLHGTLKKVKQPNINAAGPAFVDRLLKNLNDGAYDKMKEVANAIGQ